MKYGTSVTKDGPYLDLHIKLNCYNCKHSNLDWLEWGPCCPEQLFGDVLKDKTCDKWEACQ